MKERIDSALISKLKHTIRRSGRAGRDGEETMIRFSVHNASGHKRMNEYVFWWLNQPEGVRADVDRIDVAVGMESTSGTLASAEDEELVG